MPNHINDPQLALVGAGAIAIEYARVLDDQDVSFLAIGRGAKSCETFTAATGHNARPGGLQSFLADGAALPSTAIVCVSVEELAPVCLLLLANGVSRILLEKPGGNTLGEIQAVSTAAESVGAEVFLAYNRRFYASTRLARQMIVEDGGLISLTFEFTEWAHDVEALDRPPAVKQNWFLANSSHVSDLAFFLGGLPLRFCAETTGTFSWHPSGTIFVGAGVTQTGALFSYHANWDSAGRWGVELSTSARRLILRPMERLHQTRRGTVAVEEVPLPDDLDTRFKPGLYRQVQAFLAGETSDLLPVAGQVKMVRDVYARICPNPAYKDAA
jgi:predicted dehydrogenase